MQNLETFADIEDLVAFWQPINTTEERERAESLLEYASNYLRLIARNNGVDLDTKIDDSADSIYADAVRMVILTVVKRAMLTPMDAPPVDQWSMSASPYSETMKFSNPSNDIFFKKNELQLLGFASLSGKSQIGILRGAR